MIEILHRYTKAVLYKSEPEDTIKGAVIEAVKSKADLRCADLQGADLQGADLRCADLRCAYLQGADLQGADLWCANLQGAYLQGANLRGADLRCAYLQGADLQGANLQGANEIPLITAAQSSIAADGLLIGWKKCQRGVIVKLSIPEDSKRSNATGRKCRCQFADVLEVIGAEVGISNRDATTEYRVGQRVICDEWCDDRWQECAGGIHFFITRAEAEAY